jgi:hypothetical protein
MFNNKEILFLLIMLLYETGIKAQTDRLILEQEASPKHSDNTGQPIFGNSNRLILLIKQKCCFRSWMKQ